MRKNTPTIDPLQILKIVCDYYQMEEVRVLGKSRRQPIIKARHIARFLIRFNTDLGLNEIARLMIGSKHKGNDHTTILNSCKVVTNWMETDEDFNLEVQEIQMRVMEHKKMLIDQLKAELVERRLKLLEKEPPQLPEPKLVRMEILSPADEVRRKYL